jgi:uncharacterized RDD family membrane protein YckC
MMSIAPRTGGDLGEGVFYAAGDYTSLVRRLLILVIDSAVIIAFGYGVEIVLGIARPQATDRWLPCIWAALSWTYLTIIEASPLGTLGFLLTGAKVVNLKGERPSVFRMTLRLLLWVIGPFNLLLDVLWLAGDRRRQMLRDKIAGTYVVRKTASPAGRGRIRLANLMILGLNLAYPEVGEAVPRAAR